MLEARTGLPGDDLLISPSEFHQRWRNVQGALRERGFDGALIWSRGGGAFDGHWDVGYLTNFYSPFPLVADWEPHWSGRSHCALVMPADGEPTFVVDVPDWREDQVVVEDTRYSPDVVGTVAAVVRERGLEGARLALVGETSMVASTYRLLAEKLSGTQLESANDLVENLHVVKSEAELELIRNAAAVGSEIVSAIMESALKPGSTEGDAAAAGLAVAGREAVAVLQLAIASGPYSYSFTHGGLPAWTKRVLEEGDIFHVDCFGFVNGYQFDFGRACIVGGRPTPEQLEVLETGIDAVQAGIDAARPGTSGADLAGVMRGVLESRDMLGDGGDRTTPWLTKTLLLYGHSFGVGWGWPWINPHEERKLQPGMTLALEVMPGTASVGATYFEQDVIVTDDGAEVISVTPERFW
jgi:Xaa-Pro aminopeptidase